MTISAIRRYLKKTPRQRAVTLRFFATLCLARLPYAPRQVRFPMSPNQVVSLWWSHFPATANPNADSLFDYWGEDLGDLRFIWQYLDPGMTFIDVGANEGVYSVIASLKLGATGRVVAFEPSPREVSRLKLHVWLNRLSTIEVVPAALASHEGNATLITIVEGNTGRNSLLHPDTTDPVKPVGVRVTTLDRYLARTDINTADVVKIDAEGAELKIFEGAHRLLQDIRPLIICEVLDQSTRPWSYPAREIVHYLQDHSYEWFEILPDGGLLSHSCQREYLAVKNYLAVPKERRERIERFQRSSKEFLPS